MELEVTDNPERTRFEVRADGEIAGFVDYRLADGEIALLHAETDSRLRRRGIGGRLVQSSLDSARERNLAVLPYCSFVRRWIADHPEYADLVPAGRRQQFGLLPAGSSLTGVPESLDPVAYNRAAWDREVERGNEWTRPVGPDVIASARAGHWSVVLIGYEPVPRDWFPDELAGAAVLCLASGGGQQGPVLAAAGADVTVFDNSPRQLGRDQEVAAREGLAIRTVLGDMRDLGAFADSSFDLILNPVSNVFCPDLAPVWRECFRVLRPAAALLAGFMNPDVFIFDIAALEERNELVVRHRIPFTTADLPDAERLRDYGDGPIEYSHTLTTQIGGQLTAGFTLTHLVEAPHHVDATARYLPGYIATRAVKPSG